MRDENMIVRQRQLDMRCAIDERGFHLKAVASKAGLPYATLLSYFPGEKDKQPANMPASAIYALIAGEALPLEIMSMLLPAGVVMIRAPEGVNHDELEEVAREYLAEKGKAHHPNSPAGREISECERARLDGKAAGLRVAA